MAMNFTQTGTDDTTICTTNAEREGCSGRTTTAEGIQTRMATVGGTAGSNLGVNLAASATNAVATSFTLTVDSGVSWDSGTWTVRLNVSTANMNLTWTEVYVCRANSSGANQATIGSNTSVATSLGTTGVKTATVSGSAQTPSAGDVVNVVCVFTNGSMSTQAAVLQSNQDIDTPLTASADITVTPGAGAATYSGQTPVPFVLDPKTTTPDAGAVAYSGLAPTPGEQVFRTPDAGAVVYTGQASTLDITQNVTTNPTAGAVVYAGQTPTEVVTANQFTSPDVGSVVYAGQTPTPGIGEVVQPPAGAVAYSGLAPTESLTENQTVTPSSGAVAYSGQAPTESVTANQFTSPGSGTVVYAGQQPVANAGASQTTQPDAGSVAYGGLEPLLAITADQITVPGAGSYTYSGLAPTEVISGVVPPDPTPDVTPAGRSRRRRERFIARHKGQDHEFDSIEQLEAFVESLKSRKVKRPSVRITVPQVVEEELANFDLPSIQIDLSRLNWKGALRTWEKYESLRKSQPVDFSQVKQHEAYLFRKLLEMEDEELMLL